MVGQVILSEPMSHSPMPHSPMPHSPMPHVPVPVHGATVPACGGQRQLPSLLPPLSTQPSPHGVRSLGEPAAPHSEQLHNHTACPPSSVCTGGAILTHLPPGPARRPSPPIHVLPLPGPLSPLLCPRTLPVGRQSEHSPDPRHLLKGTVAIPSLLVALTIQQNHILDTPPAFLPSLLARCLELLCLAGSIPGQAIFLYYLWTGRQLRLSIPLLVLYILPNAFLPQFGGGPSSTILGIVGVLSFCLIMLGDFTNLKLL